MTYKVELIDKKYPLSQLEASKSSIKDLFKYLLDQTTGFKYQITIKILLKRYKGSESEFSLVYFNSTTETVINHKFDLENSVQVILYGNDNWINERSGWIVESVHWVGSQYINISTFTTLIGSSYIKLPAELRNPKKGLIKIKNNHQKCFLWCHIRNINPVKVHPQRITQIEKKIIDILDYEGIKFQNMYQCFFVMKTLWLIQFTYQIKNLKIQWACYSSQVIICASKILTSLCLVKQKTKIKNIFAKVV